MVSNCPLDHPAENVKRTEGTACNAQRLCERRKSNFLAPPQLACRRRRAAGHAGDVAGVQRWRGWRNSRVASEPILSEQPPNHNKGLDHDAPGHFGTSLKAIREDNWHLHDFHSLAPELMGRFRSEERRVGKEC